MHSYIIYKASVFLTLLSFVITGQRASGQTSTNNHERTVIIIAGKQWWAIDELDKKILATLKRRGTIPEFVQPQVLMHVFINSKQLMCRITYHQKLGQPAWEVDVGLDGEIKNVSQHMKREG